MVRSNTTCRDVTHPNGEVARLLGRDSSLQLRSRETARRGAVNAGNGRMRATVSADEPARRLVGRDHRVGLRLRRQAPLRLPHAGVDFGAFSPLRREYGSETIPHGNIATLTATAAQDDALVAITPPDHDGDPANGRQLRLLPGLEVTVTVTSPDGSRERVYRLLLGGEEEVVAAGPSASCLRGAVAVGFSLVVSEDGSLDDLVACAEGRHVTALYALTGGEYVPYILGAPEFVNARFAELFADGVPALLPLIGRSEGPATPAPATPAVTEPFPTCLRGEIGEGFSLVLYEGGSVDDLEACAAGLGVTAVYVLTDGDWVTYILGAPEFVTAPFRAVFADGVPVATPLTVRGAGP